MDEIYGFQQICNESSSLLIIAVPKLMHTPVCPPMGYRAKDQHNQTHCNLRTAGNEASELMTHCTCVSSNAGQAVKDNITDVAETGFPRECSIQRDGHELSPSVVFAIGQVLSTFEEALFVGICGCLAGNGS